MGSTCRLMSASESRMDCVSFGMAAILVPDAWVCQVQTSRVFPSIRARLACRCSVLGYTRPTSAGRTHRPARGRPGTDRSAPADSFQKASTTGRRPQQTRLSQSSAPEAQSSAHIRCSHISRMNGGYPNTGDRAEPARQCPRQRERRAERGLIRDLLFVTNANAPHPRRMGSTVAWGANSRPRRRKHQSGHDRVDTIAAAPRDAVGRCATRRWPELVHLDSLSKPASAGYDRPAERRPAAAFDSVRPYGSLLQSRGNSSDRSSASTGLGACAFSHDRTSRVRRRDATTQRRACARRFRGGTSAFRLRPGLCVQRKPEARTARRSLSHRRRALVRSDPDLYLPSDSPNSEHGGGCR
jgi:hypothetical protein